MKITRKLAFLLFVFAALLLPSVSLAQQNLLVQTTLAAAVIPPPSSTTPNQPGTVQLASATGIVAQGLNGTGTINSQNNWILFVDREEMAVVGVQGTNLQVLRGYNSTHATGHASGTMVLYGKAAWFYTTDPGVTFSQGGVGAPGGGTCTVAGQFAYPWLNVRNGEMWACSPTSLTYVPWFGNANNPFISVDFGTAAASTGAQAILGPLFRLSGTNAITSFTIPVGMNATAVGGAQFCVVPTGAFTTTATNNIAFASTAVANRIICWTWNAGTSKFYPTY